jgi:outer membrane receptor for ferrienterochelin and colicin
MPRRMYRLMVAGLLALSTSPALAGTTGVLEGTVRDKRTGEALPGVNVMLTQIRVGITTDVEGRYVLQNIRAGSYDVRFSHVGYRSYVVKNVLVNADLRTRLNASLEPSTLELEEITVVQEKPLIQRDVTGTTYIMSGEEIAALPLDRSTDVLHLKAGVTSEGNVRGGKTTEVSYLVDGLPVQDVLSGELISSLPSSSIVGLTMYTGGFEAEYGNALSGIVNIVTRTGSDTHRWFVRGAKDNLFGGTQVSKTSEFELSASGPIKTGKAYYLAALNGFYTGTRWWQDFQYFFSVPVDKVLNGFAKIDYEFQPTLKLGVQGLYSQHAWRDYEFNWRYNLAGLPPEDRTSYRIAATLSHTISNSFFYTASLSWLHVASTIGDGSKAALENAAPYQYDFFLRYVEAGQRAWWSQSVQNNTTMRLDGNLKAGESDMLKFGGELTLYGLSSDVVKYEPRKTFFGKPLIDEPQLNFSTNYSYKPRAGALYIQNKLDVLSDGALLTAGLRYDFMDPRASRPAVEAIPVADSAYLFPVTGSVPASIKQQLSPRLGAAFQMMENGYIYINLGWYFQYPLFDYLYSGLDRVGLAKGMTAITGNPDLEPERTKMWEISFKYAFSHNIVGSITYFRKETSNQVDAKTFIPGDSKLAGNFGYAEYVNNPHADVTGCEIVLSRERGEWVTGEISYTYMVAEATSGSAYDGFYIAQYGLPPEVRAFPLSWDQRHTLKTTIAVQSPWGLGLRVLTDMHSGRPYTDYPTSTGFEKIDGGRFYQNNARMAGYFNMDVRLEQRFAPGWWPSASLAVYLDVRNITNIQNVRWMDSNGRIGGELGDPSGYYIGRRTRLGIQVEF